MKLIVAATGDIAVPLLGALAADKRFEIPLVITGVDKPAGRKMELTPSSVKQAARALGLPVFQPESVNDKTGVQKLRAIAPDLLLVMAYGQLLSAEVLAIPRLDCVNAHVSLLPRHRGASPVQNALLAGDETAGISVMKMTEAMDTGPVYRQFPIPIVPDDDAMTLSQKLAKLAAEKTPDVLSAIAEGELSPQPQDESQATFCKKISKADGQIDWYEPAYLIARKIRAYAGWPGTWTTWNGKMLKILQAAALGQTGEPGVVTQKDAIIFVSAEKGSLKLITVQLEGKKAMPAQEFIKGYPDLINSKLV